MSGSLQESAPVLFIGVGAMGEPMASRIAAAGVALDLSDLDPSRTAAIADSMGAGTVRNEALGDEAARFRTVILMLPASPAVESVLLGESGLLARLTSGAVVIDMSSSTPSSTVRLAEAAAEHQIGFIDAPVSGGVPKARTGELAIMVGGSADVYASRRDLLGAMGTTITHVGGSGSGHAMKALNNLLSAIGMVAAAEVLSLAASFGIDPRVALDVVNSSTGRNQATEVKYGRYIFSRTFDSGFAMRLMVKDLRAALDLARDAGVPVPISASALEEWTAAFAALGQQADHTEIASYVEHRAGVELAEQRPTAPEDDRVSNREGTP